MTGWHHEWVTRVTYVTDKDPWPFGGEIEPNGDWFGSYNKKIIKIEPYRAIQGGGGGQYSYHSHADFSVGLAVWWVEKTKVEDAPPPQTDYDKVREELQV